MTALDRIQDVADRMHEWVGCADWARTLDQAVFEMRPLLNAAREIAQDGPGHWQPANIAALIAAYRQLECDNPHQSATCQTRTENGTPLTHPAEGADRSGDRAGYGEKYAPTPAENGGTDGTR